MVQYIQWHWLLPWEYGTVLVYCDQADWSYLTDTDG